MDKNSAPGPTASASNYIFYWILSGFAAGVIGGLAFKNLGMGMIIGIIFGTIVGFLTKSNYMIRKSKK